MCLETVLRVEWNSGDRWLVRRLMNRMLDTELRGSDVFHQQVTEFLHRATAICHRDRAAVCSATHRVIRVASLLSRSEQLRDFGCVVTFAQIDERGGVWLQFVRKLFQFSPEWIVKRQRARARFVVRIEDAVDTVIRCERRKRHGIEKTVRTLPLQRIGIGVYVGKRIVALPTNERRTEEVAGVGGRASFGSQANSHS